MSLPFVQTAPGADPIIVTGFLAASPAKVFRAWTDPKVVMKWFGPTPGALISAEIDLRQGGKWRFVMVDDGAMIMGFQE